MPVPCIEFAQPNFYSHCCYALRLYPQTLIAAKLPLLTFLCNTRRIGKPSYLNAIPLCFSGARVPHAVTHVATLLQSNRLRLMFAYFSFVNYSLSSVTMTYYFDRYVLMHHALDYKCSCKAFALHTYNKAHILHPSKSYFYKVFQRNGFYLSLQM